MASSVQTVVVANMNGSKGLVSKHRHDSEQPLKAAQISAQVLEAHAAATAVAATVGLSTAPPAARRPSPEPKKRGETAVRQEVLSCGSTDAGSSTSDSVADRRMSSWSSDSAAASTSCGSPSSSEQREEASPAFHGCRSPTLTLTRSRDEVLTTSFFQCFLLMATIPHLKLGGSLRKLVNDCLRFLHACDYEHEEICSILVHASYYFEDFYSVRSVEDDEAVYILITEMYIAHCYVVDECVALNSWHKRFFNKYCGMKILDQAVLQLMKERDYCLRMPDAIFCERYEALVSS